MKVHLLPEFAEQDDGDGGIRRVVEAQRQHLPAHGIEIVGSVVDADLVATHSGGLASVPVNKPFVMHTHGLYWQEYEWPAWAQRLNRIVIDGMREADIVTVPSDWVGNAVKRGMWTRPLTLYHGVNMEEWQDGNNEGYVLWNKSRPDPVCDPAVVDALALRMPQRKFVSTFGRADLTNLRVTGRIPYMSAKQMVSNAGVYLATARETFGIGTLEAMAAGVPVVGWGWGGQAEIITHGVDGWLSRPGDYDHLQEGIEWAFLNRAKIAKEARYKIEDNFQWKDRIADYAELYSHMLESIGNQYRRPAISIIMPCYNLARFLPDAIQSVQAQSFKDWELIIVDDCSPDNTAEVAQGFARGDVRIKYLKTPQNLYLAGALNYGFGHSTGRHILPLDADNMIEANTLSVLVQALERSREFDIVYGSVRFVLEDGIRPDLSVGGNGISGWPQDFDFRGQMIQRNQIPSTALIRRKAIETAGGWRTRCQTAEDAENWTRMSSLGFKPSKVTNAATLIYRQREDSMSRVMEQWDYNSWFPWSRDKILTPFGAAGDTPADINDGHAWCVPSYEPVSISVVIPLGPGHNKYVIDAIDSVMAQSFQSWEVILIDDADEPPAWGQPTLPSWVTIIKGDKRGPGAARNKAVEIARGEYILPLDADDYLQPNAMMEFIQVARMYGGVVYSQWWDDFGNNRRVYDPPDYDANLLLSKGSIHAVTALYSKADWNTVGGMDEELTHWEDWDFQFRLADQGICGTKIASPLFTYRKNTGTRRESNMEAFDDGKAAMLSRWGDLWEGKRTMAGCTSCPGGGGRKSLASPPPVTAGAVATKGGNGMNKEPDVTLVEYMGAKPNTREYNGRETGTRYRFGGNSSHQKKYVHTADVPGLLALMDGAAQQFAVVVSQEELRPAQNAPQADQPTLIAAGSPHKEQAPVEQVGPEVFNAAKAVAPGGPVVADVVTLAEEVVGEHPVEAIKGVGMSVRELRQLLPDMALEEVTQLLAVERSQETPRSTALALLEGRQKELMQ